MGYRPFGLLPVGPVTNICSSPSFVERQAGRAAVDYVAWTERIGRMAQRDDLKAPDRTTWLSGQMSTRARKEFTARGWEVDESFSIAAER